MSKVYRSKVKWFNMALGYGFIKGLEDDKDYFVFHTQLKDHVKAGDEVEFQLIDSNKGFMAVEVNLININK